MAMILMDGFDSYSLIRKDHPAAFHCIDLGEGMLVPPDFLRDIFPQKRSTFAVESWYIDEPTEEQKKQILGFSKQWFINTKDWKGIISLPP